MLNLDGLRRIGQLTPLQRVRNVSSRAVDCANELVGGKVAGADSDIIIEVCIDAFAGVP